MAIRLQPAPEENTEIGWWQEARIAAAMQLNCH